MAPEVSGNRPVMRLTVVLLPEPFGPIRPTISPSPTVSSSPSTARAPPKWRATCVRSSTAPARQFALQPGQRARIEHPARPQVHRQHDQRPEQQIAPVAQVAQAFDQESLHENDGEDRAEYAPSPA